MINKVILVGNVGADPEIRTLESGVKVARVRIATTERIYNRETQEAKEHTEWHTVVLWRNLADVADRFIRKGSQIYVEGKLRNREWQDQQGNKRFSVEVVGDDLKLLGKKQDSAPTQSLSSQQSGSAQGYGGQQYGQGGGGYNAPQQPSAPVVMPDDDPDDLPF